MASSGTTNFRWSTLERHTESIDHRNAIEAKVLRRSMTQATEKAVSEKEKAILSAMRTMYYVIKMNLPVCHYGELVEFLRFQGMLWSWLFCWHWNSFIYFIFIFDVGNSHAWSPSHISFPSKHDAKFILFLLYPSGCEDLDNLSAGSNSTYTSQQWQLLIVKVDLVIKTGWKLSLVQGFQVPMLINLWKCILMGMVTSHSITRRH